MYNYNYYLITFNIVIYLSFLNSERKLNKTVLFTWLVKYIGLYILAKNGN